MIAMQLPCSREWRVNERATPASYDDATHVRGGR